MPFDPASLRQDWPAPSRPRPIVTIGAGSIVATRISPPTEGRISDRGRVRSRREPGESRRRQIRRCKVFAYARRGLATQGAIFDLATPPVRARSPCLSAIPVGAGVLIQKPMGADLDGATDILKVCRERES